MDIQGQVVCKPSFFILLSIYRLRTCINLVDFLPFLTMETTYVTIFLLGHQPNLKWVFSEKKK